MSPDRLRSGLHNGLRLPRTWATWTLAHGVQRHLILLGARRGDLISRLIVDPALRLDPFPGYEQLRSLDRVVQGVGLAATVEHAIADEVLRSTDFGVAAGHAELPRPAQRLLAKIADPSVVGPVEPPSMLASDPPDHTRYRRLVSSWFTARRVGGMSDLIESVATRLLDSVEADGLSDFDLVERFASQLPVAVIADLLGVREEDRAQLLAWGDLAATTLDPDLTFARYRAAERALREMTAWFNDHIARLRLDPGDDLLSRLALLEGTDRLDDRELAAVGLLVLGAGFETTVNLIGNAVVLLDAHPDQRDLLIAEPDRWGNAVEEVLRYDSPVQLTLRAANRDVEIGGAAIPAGGAILVMLGGANRDPGVFAEPQRFDVTRENADRHIAFSAGIHYCLGASLARQEAATALRLLFERFPGLRVVGEPRRKGTKVLRGFEAVPVTGAHVSAGRTP